MKRESYSTVYSVLGSIIAVVAFVFVWVGWNRPATVAIVSVGLENDDFTPIEFEVSLGRFSSYALTCSVNGKSKSRAVSPKSMNTTVNVLTGSKRDNGTGHPANILYTVHSGDRFKVDTVGKQTKIFECIDDLNQRWEYTVSFLP